MWSEKIKRLTVKTLINGIILRYKTNGDSNNYILQRFKT